MAPQRRTSWRTRELCYKGDRSDLGNWGWEWSISGNVQTELGWPIPGEMFWSWKGALILVQ